ncbi:MAG TPA: PQQ-dependent sugar dehydrogenase, partial [Solirubrobacteraceae bacterium]|nr:PQQ-dependent sugar dehydrogenase [Solirubrobacteraceae bacterium]
MIVPAAGLAAGLLFGCGGSSDGSAARATPAATQAQTEPTATATPAAAQARKGVRLVRIGSFSSPVFVTAPRGARKVQFVVEQGGRIMVVRNGRKLGTPFLDITSQVTSGGEQGLLSMAFAPDYASSGRFYVYFTDNDGDQRVVEYRRASADRADPGSARLVLRMPDSESNHNGGLLLFGPGGHLYIGTGDGGGAGDRHGARGNAQNLGSLLGKILRIDPRPSG